MLFRSVSQSRYSVLEYKNLDKETLLKKIKESEKRAKREQEKVEDLKKKLDEEIKLRQQIGVSKIFNPLFKNKALIKLIAVFCSGILLPYLIKDTETLHLIIEKIFSLIH